MSLDTANFEEHHANMESSGLHDVLLLRQLWPFIRPHVKALISAMLLLIPMSLTQLVQPFLLKSALDGPVRQGNMLGLWGLAGCFLAALLLHYWVRYFQMNLAQVTGQRIVYAIRTSLYAHLQMLPPTFYQNHPIGKLVTRVTNDVENLSDMFSSGGIAILSDVAIIFSSIAGMLIMNWRLAILTSLMLPVFIGTMEYFRKRSRRAYDDIRVRTAHMNAFLQENLSGMEVVQLYRREAKNYQDFQTINANNLKTNLSSVFYDSSFSAVVEFLTILTMMIVLWFGGHAIYQNAMTFGLLAAFFLFVQMMTEPIEDLSDKYTIIQSGLASIDKLIVLFQAKPAGDAIEITTPHPATPCKAGGAICFDHVNFSYKADLPVLKDISFSIMPGETVAIVGPSGAGKTTLIKLLTRFYAPNSGRILLDDRNIQDIPLADLRRRLVVVQQDDFLFSRTIAENIALNDVDDSASKSKDIRGTNGVEGEITNLPEIIKAAEWVNADEIIRKQPAGYREVLKERGKNLSGGEKQLLLFARAVYHDPSVLILDEATSAIDPQTEQRIQTAMDHLMADRTTIIIAHRLSTIQKADRILVIEEGCLVESGNHQELMAKPDGAYQQLFQYYQALEEIGD